MAGIKDFNFFFMYCGYVSSYKVIIYLAFSGSVAMTLLVLGCALPRYNNWWPFLLLLFYILAPVPLFISKRYNDEVQANLACQEFAIFLTTGIVISAFCLPIVLARAPISTPTIQWGACLFSLAGNIFMFLTILGFFIAFREEDIYHTMW